MKKLETSTVYNCTLNGKIISSNLIKQEKLENGFDAITSQ